jgi:hypothetical protein
MRQKQSRDTGNSRHKALNSEDKQNKNNPETQATVGIKHSTAKTNETKTIQRQRRHWAQNTQQRRQTKQKQSRDTGDIGHTTLNSEDQRNKNNPETQATLGIKHSTAKTNKTKTLIFVVITIPYSPHS